MVVYLLAILWHLAAVTCVADFYSSEHRMCKAKGRSVVKAKFANETHWLCLKLISLGATNVANLETALLLDPDAEDLIKGLPVVDIQMARGYSLDDPAGGSAEGYIAEDNHFYGLLHIHNRTLHADPYGLDDPSKSFGPYGKDTLDVTPRRHTRRDNDQMPYFGFNLENARRRRPGVAHARVCELLLLADQMFLKIDANGSLNHAVMRMVHAVDQADVVFRNADFNEDGVPDNIGFSIKYIIVLASDETTQRVFGDLLRERAVNGHDYLMRLSRLRRLADVCLGVAFSGHAFLNRTFGLSFTSLGGGLGFAAGGICDRRAFGRSFNTIALAHSTMEQMETFRIPERVVALTMAHEMGHSFGAHHDDSFPNPECRDHLMSAQSTNATVLRNYEFSLCSKRLISDTVAGMGYCLLEEDKPFCGNGIVEEGESCDCGHPSGCVKRDRCCTPRSGGALLLNNSSWENEGCVVAPSAECHPSQGFCCDSNCKFADLRSYGINCKTQQLPCDCSVNTALCRCGLGGRCLPDGTCHAAECAQLGLKECRCPKGGTDGEIRAQGGCGICCRLPSRTKRSECVGAELAARHLQRRKEPIPDDWPDEDYRGPNITIRLCPSCSARALRAWPAGAYCVSRNQVGVCSSRNQCKPGGWKPRGNVYPETQALKLSNGSEIQLASAAILLNCMMVVMNKL